MLSKEKLIERLRGILNLTSYDYFVGGTLCIDYVDENGKTDVELVNVSNPKTDPEVRQLAALIYIIWKEPSSAHFELCRTLLRGGGVDLKAETFVPMNREHRVSVMSSH